MPLQISRLLLNYLIARLQGTCHLHCNKPPRLFKMSKSHFLHQWHWWKDILRWIFCLCAYCCWNVSRVCSLVIQIQFPCRAVSQPSARTSHFSFSLPFWKIFFSFLFLEVLSDFLPEQYAVWQHIIWVQPEVGKQHGFNRFNRWSFTLDDPKKHLIFWQKKYGNQTQNWLLVRHTTPTIIKTNQPKAWNPDFTTPHN